MDNDEKLNAVVLLLNVALPDLGPLNSILSPAYTVLTAQSKDGGLAQVVEKNPALILLDTTASSPDGLEILKALKTAPDTRDIPVIVISGRNSEADEEKSFDLGAVDYFTRPFRSVIVKARVRTQLQIIHQIQTIERMGRLDPLTNIPNRRSFDERISLEWRRCLRDRTPLSFMMIDVDYFKLYNDTYGHVQGDMYLKALAKIFSSWARRPADLVARLGGEEFGLLLPNTPLEAALEIGENLRAEVEALRVYTEEKGTETKTTVSIGAASAIPIAGMSAGDIIKAADTHLYEAKASGRNRVCSGKK